MKIAYEITFSKRKTLNITVERDRRVTVRSPENVSLESIDKMVQSKRQWIKGKLNHIQKYPVELQSKEFVSGESLLYLGTNYQLTVLKEGFLDNSLEKTEDIIFNENQGFKISKANQSQANELFKKWYMAQALLKITPLAVLHAKNLGVIYKCVKISTMQYRWASCTPSNTIIFNWRIIKAPLYVLDYLVVHELVHLLESNHTPQFWTILSIQVPDYLKAKNWLKENGHLLEIDF